MGQLQLSDVPNPSCPFTGKLEANDGHCFELGMGRAGYDVISEDHPDLDTWLASIRGVGLHNVVARPVQLPVLPDYIPTVRNGSGKLFATFQPEYACVLLGDVVSPVDLNVAANLHKRLGVPIGTKLILLGYGSDQLIENLWPKRKEIFRKLAGLGFHAVSAVNYSIWDDQPHAERFINMKRGLLTFEDWQNLGIPAIPHIYWYGRKDLDAWIEWLELNPCVTNLAINLQTLRSDSAWSRAIEDLRYFSDKLKVPYHFLITGPQSFKRIKQIQQIFPDMTLTNGYASRMAANGFQIKSDDVTSWPEFFDGDRSNILATNVGVYERYMALMRGNRNKATATVLKT
jgi:hypothetical protein